MNKFILSSLLLIFSVQALFSQELNKAIEDEVKAYRENFPGSAIAVGIIIDGKIHRFFYGTPNKESETPIDQHTLFDIGSVTKVFTGLLLSMEVQKDPTLLDKTLKELLPDLILRDDIGQIKIKELCTHSSGLPRIPGDIMFNPSFDMENPYKEYDELNLLSFLKNYSGAPLKKEFGYSNLGTGLLGYLLAMKSENSYCELLQDSLLNVFNLNHTSCHVNKLDEEKLATPYSPSGNLAKSWESGILDGAFVIKSNLDDMLLFLNQCLNTKDKVLQDVITLSQNPILELNDFAIGMNWFISPNPDGSKLIWHNGMTGGFSSFLGYVQGTETGVVLLTNGATFADPLAIKILSIIKP